MVTHKKIVSTIEKAFGHDLPEYAISKIVKNCTGKHSTHYEYEISQVLSLDDYELAKMIGILSVLIGPDNIFS